MRKILLAILTLCLSGLAPLFAGGQEEKGSEQVIKPRIWFWGEDEAKGITEFMQQTSTLYEQKHPGVKWEVKHLDLSQIYTGFYAAVEAKDAPELHVLWGGVLGLEPAWAGHLTPISDYVPESVLARIYPETRAEGYWSGKQWLVPLYLDPWLFAANKKVWAEAGAAAGPRNWPDFVAALQKIKAAGSTPWSFGVKDGFYGAWFPSALQYQYYDSATDYRRAIIGQEKLTDKKHSAWWYLIAELRDKALFNPDGNSLSLAEGQDLFFTGKVGILYDVQPRITAAVQQFGVDNIDVFIAPVPGNGKLKGKLPIPAIDLAIPAVAKHKEEAGRFLQFFLGEERQNALYEKTGIFPATNYVKSSLMKHAVDAKIHQWVNENASMTYEWNHPGALEEAVYAITQQFFAEKLRPEIAAQEYEAVAERWRNENPAMLEKFKVWANEKVPFLK
jgi:raffinose/stachyose/melibiose transport system substrate-binding protein